MIEIKRDSDYKITNFREIKKELQDSAGEIYDRLTYYARKYLKGVKKSINNQFDTYQDYKKASKESAWYNLIDTRKILINGINIEFFIWATTSYILDINMLIETKNKKDYIILFLTGAIDHEEEGGLIIVPREEKVGFLPIIVEDHFITRYIQRQKFDGRWKVKMMLDFGFLSDYLNRARMVVDDKFEPLTNAELIGMKEPIFSLINNGEIEKVRDRVFRSCLYAAFRAGFAFAMIPPKSDEMYVIKTYLVPEQLKERQKEVLYCQAMACLQIRGQEAEYIMETFTGALKQK